MSTANEMVWCVLCVGHEGADVTQIFSSPGKRAAWVDSLRDGEYRTLIHYDYVIDDPDRMEKPPRKAQ